MVWNTRFLSKGNEYLRITEYHKKVSRVSLICYYISNISLIIKQKVCFMISLCFFHLVRLLLPWMFEWHFLARDDKKVLIGW